MDPVNKIYVLSLALSTVACVALSSVCGCGPHDCELTLTCKVECEGECVPLPPLGFDGPALLWMGPVADLPSACPDRAPQPVYQGFAGLDGSHECPPCQCSEPVCVLPSGVTATDLPLCDMGPTATVTPYDAPAGWDGTCTSSGTITSDKLNSVSIAPATVHPCEPVTPDVPMMFEGLFWAQAALACAGEALENVCGDPGMTCLPSAEPPPPGFRQCILYTLDGEPNCPADYPEKYTFYQNFEDTRACTDCECAETQPSTCVASVSAYQATDCTSPLFENNIGTCVDGMPNVTLGSISAQWVTNAPGACAPSGGEPIGEATPVGPARFCCQPPP